MGDYVKQVKRKEGSEVVVLFVEVAVLFVVETVEVLWK